MSGRSHHPLGARSHQFGAGDISMGLLEQKVLTQHNEIQRILSENQRLAAMHMALRQELALTQRDVQRGQQALPIIQIETEQQIRAVADKTANFEAHVRAAQPLKSELENAKANAHKLLAVKQDLMSQLNELTREIQKVRSDSQQVPALKAEMEGLQDEINRARAAFEYEKKANADLLDQRGVMEKNLFSMSREIEKLHAELAHSDLKAQRSYAPGLYGMSDSGHPRTASYGDSYGVSQRRMSGDGSGSAWGSYDMQRDSGSLMRR